MTGSICLRSGGKVVLAADDVAGVHYPRIKLSLGPDGTATDLSEANPLPVAIISGGGEGSSGGLTDTELRAAPVPISGTVTANVGTVAVTGSFYPATQPISGAVNINGTVPVSGSFYQVTQPVSIASMPSTPVTGTFWPATQPVSGTVAVSGSVAVTGTFFQATQPVSIASMPSTPVTGTFYQATQPVSGTVTANAGSGTFAVSGTFWQATQPVSGTFFQATQPVSIAATVAVSLAALPATPAGTNLIGRVQPLFAARVVRNFILDTFTAAPVSEALQSVVQWYNNAAVGATTQPAVVPAGKILRLTSWGIETKSLATVGSAVVRVRANVSGVAVLGSPLAGSFSAGSIAGATTVAMTGGFSGQSGDFGEGGLEFAAATGIAFSMAGYGPTGTLTLEGVTRFWVYGYEYTA